MARKERSKAAYFLVDLSELDADVRQELIEDAQAGGGEYGLRVVEMVYNGPAQSPIYGVYFVDQEKWNGAKDEFNIGSADVDDSEVHSTNAPVDSRSEAAVRQAAIDEANAAADKVNAAEAENLDAIVSDDTAKSKTKR